MNTLVEIDGDDNVQFDSSYIDLNNDKIIDLIHKFERKRANKKGTIVDEESDQGE